MRNGLTSFCAQSWSHRPKARKPKVRAPSNTQKAICSFISFLAFLSLTAHFISLLTGLLACSLRLRRQLIFIFLHLLSFFFILSHSQLITPLRCKLKELADEALLSVNNLIELDLRGNQLSDVPSQALRHCPIVRKLMLNENPIKWLRNGSFTQLSSLRSLDLSNCEIELVEGNAFEGLKSLRNLHLNGNRLR